MNNEILNIIIVEDEPLSAMFIERVVIQMGHKVVGIYEDSDNAFLAIKQNKPDIIFMDINIYGSLDGIDLTKNLALGSETEVLYISSYSDSEIIDKALLTNPSNYLIKPIKEEELKIALTLIKKRRNTLTQKDDSRIFLLNELYYDLDTHELYEIGHPFSLSLIEKKLIDLFIKNRNTTVSVEQIEQSVWESKPVANSTIRDAISLLRKKIPDLPLKTNFGRGYTLSTM